MADLDVPTQRTKLLSLLDDSVEETDAKDKFAPHEPENCRQTKITSRQSTHMGLYNVNTYHTNRSMYIHKYVLYMQMKFRITCVHICTYWDSRM